MQVKTTVTENDGTTATADSITAYVYDLAGNLISQTDGVGNTITYEYNAFEKVSKAVYPGDETTQAENTIIYQYDIMGNLTKTEDSFGTINAYTHDKQGRQLSNTTKGKDSNKAITTTVQYDINGNKRYETDGNSNTKEYVYDELNRLIENRITTTNINAEKIVHTTKNVYDLNNNQVKQIDWRGNVFESIYDPLNRLIEKKDPYATIQKLEYNANHVQIKSYDSKNKATIFGYDKLNRLIYTADSLGHSTKQSYDSIGNIELKIDGLNNTTRYTYDFLNRLSTVTNPKGEVTSYTYDLNGNKLTQKDGKGNFTSYEYNAAQKLIHHIDHGGRTWATNKYTYVDGKVESYTYYQNGLLKTKLDRNGVTTNYSYDSFGRMLSQEAGAQKVSYTYDDNGNQLTMTDVTGQTVRTYDELNRVATKTVPQFGTNVFQYDIQLGIAEGYVEDGYVGEKSIDSKGNETLKITDKVGRLKAVKADSETTGTVYQYDGNGNRTSVTYENGAKEVYTYYDDNLLATLTNYGTTGNVIESYQYTYDAAHNQKTKVDAKGTTSYTYDTLNRLTERIINGSQTTLTMYAYDERNRLLTTTLQTPTGSKEISKYVYDNNGNTLQKTKETTKKADPLEKPSFSMFIIGQTDNEFSRSMVINEYDLFNQLVTTKTGAQIANYVYNGEGRRVQKNVNGQATNYLYEYDKVVLETDGKGKQTARNVYGINLLSRTIDNQKVNYLYNGHADVTP